MATFDEMDFYKQDELLKICDATNQTVFMITHDVDEAILLADRVLLMTNGPYARVAESVKIDIARPRDRSQIIHHPAYYAIRNHLVDFLVRRSKELSGSDVPESAEQTSGGHPLEVNPAAEQSGGVGITGGASMQAPMQALDAG